MFISNSIVSYIFNKKKISILLIISLYFGWGVLKAKSLYFNKLNRFKSYSVLYYNQFLGFLKNYSVFFKFKGMGIKLIGHSQGLIFKVGNSHRVFLSKHKEIKYIYSKKRLLLLKSRASFFFYNFVAIVRRLNKNSIYLKKGVYIKGFIFNLKITSKKSKF